MVCSRPLFFRQFVWKLEFKQKRKKSIAPSSRHSTYDIFYVHMTCQSGTSPRAVFTVKWRHAKSGFVFCKKISFESFCAPSLSFVQTSYYNIFVFSSCQSVHFSYTCNWSYQYFLKCAQAPWHSGHQIRLQNRRSRVRIPPGVRFLGIYTLQCCCHNLICIVLEKNVCFKNIEKYFSNVISF
jgi:hypothetical protein